MSYCRFSDECDVYAYQQEDGSFFVHVSSVSSPTISDEDADQMTTAELIDFLRTNARPIGGRFDGRVFQEDNPSALFRRLRDVASVGYRIPIQTFEYLHKQHPEVGLDMVPPPSHSRAPGA